MAKKMKWHDWIPITLLIIGGLNWGLFGLFNFNLVTAILGQWPTIVKIVYDVVGIAAIWSIISLVRANI